MENNNSSNDVLRLNVGGQKFITKRATLCALEGSMLATLFSTDSNFAPLTETGGGEIFLDRDPVSFPYILNYLRDGCRLQVDLPNNKVPLLQRIRADADYFGLVELVSHCDEKICSIQQPKKIESGKKKYYK